MSALANHPFVKMNGLGNEIVVVDMRADKGAITAEDARAAAQPAGAPYDQMMVLHPPRLQALRSAPRPYRPRLRRASSLTSFLRLLGTSRVQRQ